MIKKKSKVNIGLIIAMLGIGLTLAFLLPAQCLVVVLSLVLIICGIALCKSC